MTAIAIGHIDELDKRIEEMRDAISHLVQICAGDRRPDCQILVGLPAPMKIGLPHGAADFSYVELADD